MGHLNMTCGCGHKHQRNEHLKEPGTTIHAISQFPLGQIRVKRSKGCVAKNRV